MLTHPRLLPQLYLEEAESSLKLLDRTTDTCLLLSLTCDLLRSQLYCACQKVLLTFLIPVGLGYGKDFRILQRICLAPEASLELGRMFVAPRSRNILPCPFPWIVHVCFSRSHSILFILFQLPLGQGGKSVP